MKRLGILGAAALLALAGCGGSSDNSSSSATTGTTSSSGGASAGGGGQQLALQADPSQLKFDKSTLTAKAGKVTITMTNPSPLQHDIAIKGGADAQGDVVGQGGKSTVSIDLKPGKYTFYCSVDGHEAAGMTGTLTVS
jgi:plastocyanin